MRRWRLVCEIFVAAGAITLFGIPALDALASPNRHNHKVAEPSKKCKPLRLRTSDPLDLERNLRRQHAATHIFGSDESGTGCLAGPVVCVTCCIVQPLADYLPFPGVADSKALTADECRRVYQHVVDNTPGIYQWTTAVRSSVEIDAAPSVRHCTLDAFRESIDILAQQVRASAAAATKTTTTPAGPVSIYSIVDGHRAPPQGRAAGAAAAGVVSRPWKSADATVYTVALASGVARTLHEDYMIHDAAGRYPAYGFAAHGGYATPPHLAALHTHGPCPIHRKSCKPVRDRLDTTTTTTEMTTTTTSRPLLTPPPTTTTTTTRATVDRHSFLAAAALLPSLLCSAVASTVAPARAVYVDAKTGRALPEVGEIANAVPTVWTADTGNPIHDVARPFARLDGRDDSVFYEQPRFVEHVDDQAVRLLTDYIETCTTARPQHRLEASASAAAAVLDVCASWTSHLPAAAPLGGRRVAGLGMNAQELAANRALTEWTVHDLNARPVLPYASGSFGVVLCQLSIDYLTQPVAVCAEMGRVLAPGGAVHIIFSNRLFLSKAVALWTGKDDIDRAYTVAAYLHLSGADVFTDIQARDLSVRQNGRIVGDPLYVVTATKGEKGTTFQ